MAGFNDSPNMMLPVPTPDVQSGPAYAFNLNGCMALIDSHNHTTGQGVQLPIGGNSTTSAVNVVGDLAMNDFNLTYPRTVRFQAQSGSLSGALDLACVYAAPNSGSSAASDLWFNDGSGNKIPLTSSGALAASAAAIAGQSYSGGTFIWKQGAGSTTPANFDIGSIILRNNIASTVLGLTLSPPTLVGNISITLPFPAPSSPGSFVTIDTSGVMSSATNLNGVLTSTNLSASANITGSQLSSSANIVGTQLSASATIASTQLATPNSITGSQIATGTITHPNLAAPVYVASGSGAYSNNTTTYTSIAAVAITTTGKPVMITLSGSGGTTDGSPVDAHCTSTSAHIQLDRNGTVLAVWNIGVIQANPLTCITFDSPSAGNPTYTFSGKIVNAGTLTCNSLAITVMEIV